MALVAYRQLLRSARVAFQGDARLLSAAREQARAGFESGRDLPLSSDETSARIAHAEEVAKILRHNIVQGQIENENKGNYKLRIHEEIERGDNDSVKISDSGLLKPGQCCSSL
ncbi:hypothetical protein L228DRAFT_268070 [Xylona heveae TC161]|uniref:Mitochondrial zinc maintenance protein 1, mitochondrial n=1 Tax=Xylona heveae (strain CBS 132557 / TC161) TaxID=1328760 RepID=A0A165GWF7_XYLHT|nr:hypothetical protein L228DRAFT_268070 [Xylona heveae TC161]KZF22684.1 hypothetical protein L228DRAFT_268070 [Xylona heveae TC161]